jgi:tripartite-type tricarboxylate transporter receptor subunit TctC
MAALLMAACAPAAPSPTAAPAKPAEAAKPAATAAPAKPTEAPAAKPAEAKPAPSTGSGQALSKAEGPAASPAAKSEAKPAASPAAKPAFDEKAVADFYKGKTLKIIVGFSAGGGFDTFSRVIGRHISRYIPGNPTVIVENMPGAGSILAANTVYANSPKDGTIIGNISAPIVLEQIFKTKGVEYDMAKFRPIGVPVSESYLTIVHSNTGIKKFEDLLAPGGKEVAFGAIPGSSVEHAPVLLRDVMKANIKVVTGYPGTAEVRLAMERGEVEGYHNTWQSLKTSNRDKLDSGEWIALLQLNDAAMKDLPGNVPTIKDVAKTEQQRLTLLYGTSYPNKFGKLYVMAPEVPADRAAAIEDAFTKTLADKEFLADAEKGKLEINPMSSADIRKGLAEMLGMSEDIKAVLQKVMKPTGS